MSKIIIAKEWIIFISAIVLGFVLLPSILSLLLDGSLTNFYECLSDSDNDDFLLTWMIAIGPYLLVQITRMTIWSLKRLREE